MDNFLAISFSFPTAIFTVLLLIISGYWIFTILGMFDIEMLDMDIDLDYGGDSSAVGGMAGVMIALGLVGIPVTIIFSFIILFAWLVVYMISLYLLSYLEIGMWFWMGAGAAILISVTVSIPMTIMITRPMRRFFKVSYATRSNELLGEICQVITSEVTDTFGEAELNKEGDHYIFQIRTMPDNTIKKGDDVVLVEYDAGQHLYHIKKY